MKKFLLLLACAFATVSVSADVKSVYVNPLHNGANADAVVAKRLYKKGLLGLTKAKTISISSGSDDLAPGSESAARYDYIMTFNLANASITEAGTIGNLLGAFSSSSSKNPDWEGKLETEIVIVDAKSGEEVFRTTLAPSSIDKDKELALFAATNNFDYDVTDMTDDAFRIGGEIIEATEFDKKNNVKKVRVQVGRKDGARKNQSFELYKVVGDEREPIGVAKCERVLNADESILSINGKKDADKVLSELIQNCDGSYTVEALSRSRSGFIHNNFQGIDKMFTNEGRSHYMDPFNRDRKHKVAFLGVAVNDSQFDSHKEAFQKKVVAGMKEVPTVDLEPMIYESVEEAAKAGVDGLLEITVDKVFNTTEKTSDGKTRYKTRVLYSVAGIDVANNKWIDMKSFSEPGSSTESADKAKSDAISLMDNNVQKFSEDLFPVAANAVNAEEVKKNSVRKVRIDIGTGKGVKKGMAFDIFEQRTEGGADSLFPLGEGKVEKDGLTAGEAILKVKGKNNGDERLFELLKNMDEDTKVVLVSKASYDILEKGLNFLNRTN